jgi:hypothetical protein
MTNLFRQFLRRQHHCHFVLVPPAGFARSGVGGSGITLLTSFEAPARPVASFILTTLSLASCTMMMGGTASGGEIVSPGLLDPLEGGNLNALFIVPVLHHVFLLPEGVVADSSSSDPSESPVIGSDGGVGSIGFTFPLLLLSLRAVEGGYIWS